jgi:Protein of unknown function (DUF1559)
MATSSSFKVACPSCEAMVPIRDASLVGKKVDCPKCKYRFVVEVPEGAEAAVGGAAKKGAPAGRKLAAVPKAGDGKGRGKPLPRRDDDEEDVKPEKKKKGSNTLLIGGVIGVLAIGLLVVGYFAFFNDSTPTKPSGGGGGGTPVASTGPTSPSTEATQGEQAAPDATQGENTAAAPSDPVGLSNLIPEDSQIVIAVDGPKFLNTPIGSSIFETRNGAEDFLKSTLGFGPTDVQRYIFSGSHADGWVFNVIRLRSPLKIDTLKKVLGLDPKAKTIKNRDYYLIKNNDLVKMLGGFLASELKELKDIGITYATPAGGRNLAMNLLDPQTMIIADVEPMERFLNADAQPRKQSQIAPAASDGSEPGIPGIPMGPGSSTPPMAAPGTPFQARPTPPMFPGGGPPGGGPPGGSIMPGPGGFGPPGQGGRRQLFTNNPAYLTIDPNLKAMLNQLDEKNEAALVAAIRLPNLASFHIILDFFKSGKLEPTVAENAKAPILGLAITRCDRDKLQMAVALEVGKDADANALRDQLNKTWLQLVANELMARLNIPVEVRTQGQGQGPYNPEGGYGPPGYGPPGYGPPGAPNGPMPPGEEPPVRPGGRQPMGSSSNVRPSAPGEGKTFQAPPGYPPNYPGGPGQQPPGYPPNYPGGPGTMPGFPGGYDPNNPNKPKIDSFLSASTTDRVVVVNVELDWKLVYNSRVMPPVRSVVEGRRGKAVMMAGRSHWTNLAAAVRKLNDAKPAGGAQTYPRGALPRRPDMERFGMPYPPDQRVSWMVDMLPFLGYDALYSEIDKDKSWNHDLNLKPGERWVPEFLNPNAPPETWVAVLPSLRGRVLGATHFVGLSGIGLDSADFADDEQHAKKLGIFGNDRDTKLEDVQKGDGLSNTIFMIQVAPNLQRPWIRGGGSTVQGVPETNSVKPFVTLQDGGKFGTYAVMADGSVRFIASTIDDEAFKALVTYKGGEKVDIDQIAPRVDKGELKTPGSEDVPIGNALSDWRDVFIPEMLGYVKFPGRPTRVVIMKPDPNDKSGGGAPFNPGVPFNPGGAKDNKQKMIPTGDFWYEWKSGESQLLVRADLLENRFGQPGERDLNQLSSHLQTEYRLQPSDIQITTASGQPALSFETANADARYRHLAFIYNRRVIEMRATTGRIPAADVKRFFDSLQVEDPQLNKWETARLDVGGIRLTAELPGHPLPAVSKDNPFERAVTVNFPDGRRFFIEMRNDSALPDKDLDGKAADGLISKLKDQSPKSKTEYYDVKRVDVSGVEGREYKTTSKEATTLNRVFVQNGIAISMHVYEPDKVSAALMKRFWDSVKIGTSPSGTPATPKVDRGAEKAPEPKTAAEWQEVKIPEINASISFSGKTQRVTRDRDQMIGYLLENESIQDASIGLAVAPGFVGDGAYDKLVESAKAKRVKPETIKKIDVQGRLGFAADQVTDAGEVRSIMLLDGQHLVVLVAHKTKLSDADAEKFFKSLKFNGEVGSGR